MTEKCKVSSIQCSGECVKMIRNIITLLQNRCRVLFSIFYFSFLLCLPLSSTFAANIVTAWGAGGINGFKTYDSGQSQVPAGLTNVVLVAGGLIHSLALNTDGSLQGWGNGQLGQTDFPAINHSVAVSCGWVHSLALLDNGIVLASGDDSHGQTDVPANLSNVVAVACGFYHSLALKSDGTVVAWGPSTNAGSIGVDPDYGQTLIPAGLSNVVAIAGGGWHSLALKGDGTVVGWGRADYNQAYIPVGITNVVAIAAGAVHNLALLASGKVAAWGDNSYEQTNVPAGLSNVVAIAAGGWHSLALKRDGTVVSWGAGSGSSPSVDYGQNRVPVNLTNVAQIYGGVFHSLALSGNTLPAAKVPVTISNNQTNGIFLSLPTTRSGRVYQMQFQNVLGSPIWNSLLLQAGQGSSMTFTDAPTVVGQRFYRVCQW